MGTNNNIPISTVKTIDMVTMEESDAASQSVESSLSRPPSGFSTPVQCRRTLPSRRGGGKNPTKRNSEHRDAAKLAIFKHCDDGDYDGDDIEIKDGGEDERSIMSEVVALHSAASPRIDDNASIQSAPAHRMALQQQRTPITERTTTTTGYQQEQQQEDEYYHDSPSAVTVEETTHDTYSEGIPSPTGSVLSRYGRPDDYINTPGSASRRAWKRISPHKSAPAGQPSRVSSFVKNIRLPLDISSHSQSQQGLDGHSSHSVGPGGGVVPAKHHHSSRPRKWSSVSSQAPPMSISSGMGAGGTYMGSSKKKQPWKAKSFSHADVPDDLPPAFKTSLSSPKRNPDYRRSPHSGKPPLVITRTHEPERVVAKREKTTLSPMKLKRKWPPTTSKVDTKIISTNRVKGVVPEEAVKTRRSHFEKTWEEPEKITADPIFIGRSSHRSRSSSRVSTDISESNDGGGHNSFGSFGSLSHGEENSHHRWNHEPNSPAPPDTTTPQHRNVSIRVCWGGKAFLTVEGRPMYFEEIFPNPPGLGNLLYDRFKTLKSDGTLPKLPRRRNGVDEDVGDLDLLDDSYNSDQQEQIDGENHLRPDVWITPMDEDVAATSQDVWRVRRMWNVDDLDQHEVEHAVEGGDLIGVVKVLLGVSSSEEVRNENGDILTYDPESTLWKAKTVYDVEGEIDESSKTQNLNEAMFHMAIKEIKDAKFTFGRGQGDEVNDDDDDEWTGNRIVNKPDVSESSSMNAKFSYGAGNADEDDDDEWNGRSPEKPVEKKSGKPDSKFSYGFGENGQDDDDEWKGKSPEELIDSKTGKRDGKFSFGSGENEENDDDEWHGKSPDDVKSGNPDGRFSYGAGNTHEGDDDDEDWNQAPVVTSSSAKNHLEKESDALEAAKTPMKDTSRYDSGRKRFVKKSDWKYASSSDDLESSDHPPTMATSSESTTPRISGSQKSTKKKEELEELTVSEPSQDDKDVQNKKKDKNGKKKKKKKDKDYDHGMMLSDLLSGGPPMKIFHSNYS